MASKKITVEITGPNHPSRGERGQAHPEDASKSGAIFVDVPNGGCRAYPDELRPL